MGFYSTFFVLFSGLLSVQLKRPFGGISSAERGIKRGIFRLFAQVVKMRDIRCSYKSLATGPESCFASKRVICLAIDSKDPSLAPKKDQKEVSTKIFGQFAAIVYMLII